MVCLWRWKKVSVTEPRYCASVYWQRRRKTWKTSVRTAGVLAEIGTKYLPPKHLERHRYMKQLGHSSHELYIICRRVAVLASVSSSRPLESSADISPPFTSNKVRTSCLKPVRLRRESDTAARSFLPPNTFNFRMVLSWCA